MADLQDVEADWTRYFHSIRHHCPWSLNAWQRNRILICDWESVKTLGEYQAIVYVVDLTPSALRKLADDLNQQDEDCEWLWSHPKGGGKLSTPRPCLIQQDRQLLEKLRSQLNRTSN